MASSSPRLTVLGGPLAGKELSIEDAVDNVLIGSDPSCRFCLPLPGISPIHARVWVDLQGVTIYDTNAPEGLYVNDDKVTGQAPLRNGDILWLGAPGSEGVVMIQCRIPPRAAAMATPVPAVTAAPEPDDDEDEYDEPTVALPAPVAEPSSATEVVPPEDVLAAEAVVPEPVRVEPEPLPVEPVPVEPEPDETVQVAPPVEATLVLPPGPTPPPAPLPVEPLEEDLDHTVVTHGGAEEETVAVAPPVPPPPPPAEVGTLVLGGELPPWTTTPVPPPVATTPAPVPPSMELPPVSPVFEEDIEEGVPATVVLPAEPPPPPPAPPRAAAPPPAPAAKPAPRPAAPARPAPVKATPAKPAPAPVAAPPAATPAPAAPRPPKAKSGGGAGLLIGLAAVLLLAVGGGGAAWYFLLGPGKAQPTPAPSAPPVTLAQATPLPATPEPAPTATPEIPVEETTVPVAPPTPAATPSPGAKPTPAATPSPGKPSPSPGAKPSAAPSAAPTPDAAALRAQQVATLVGQADQAAAEKRFDAALALYDQALQLEPANAQASRGKAQAQAALSAAAAASKRAFVSGRSVLVGAKTDKKLSGFESEDVAMAKAPDYSGRIEFEASPRSPRAGEPYTVRVFLLNDGKKDFKIAGMTASTNASGEKSGGPMAATTREIAPQQRALIQELTGVWKDGATSWSLDVSVQSAHGETVKNTLTWR